MKKYFYLFLLLVFPLFSNCQSVAGIKAGFDNYRFTHPDYGHSVETIDYLGSSPVIGVFWRERSGNLVQIAAELTYLYRSFWVDANSGGLGGGNALVADYYVNNLIFRFEPQFVFGRKLKFYVYPGFYFNFSRSTVSGNYHSWRIDGYYVEKSIHSHSNSYYPKFYTGICAGTGMEYNAGKNILVFADFCYNMSLSEIGDMWENPRLKLFDYNITAGIGYRFGNFSFKEFIKKAGEAQK